MNENSKRNALVKGTALLTIASLVAKILSAVYRIPFQNMVGNVGFYVYQQVYPIYGIAMTFALSGLPVFISKLVVDSKSEADKLNVVHHIQRSLMISCVIIFIGLQIGAQQIAFWMNDGRLSPVIASVSWMFLIVPFLASWRGYFQGHYMMKPTAYSQVLEQFVRVSVILVVAYWSVKMGMEPHRMGQFAMLSAPIATLMSAMVLFGFRRHAKVGKLPKLQPIPGLSKRLLLEGITICLVASVMLLLQLVDSFSVVANLLHIGANEIDAQNTKGIYDRAQTLVQLGLVITTASTTAMLPQLVSTVREKQINRYKRLARACISTNFGIACAMSAGMFSLMAAINPLLFATPELSLTIAVYCLSVLVASMILVINTIFQSRDVYIPTIWAIGAAVLSKIILNHLLIRSQGIMGASEATILSLLVAVVVMTVLGKQYLVGLVNWSQLSKLVGISLIMWIVVLVTRNLTQSVLIGKIPFRADVAIQTLVGVVVGVIVFIGLALAFNALDEQEWSLIPMGEKINKIRGERK